MECVIRHPGYILHPDVNVPSGSHPVCSRNRMLWSHLNNLQVFWYLSLIVLALIVSIGVTSHPLHLNIVLSEMRITFHLSTLRQSAEILLLFCPDGSVIGVMCNILHVLAAGIDNDDRDVGGSQVYLLNHEHFNPDSILPLLFSTMTFSYALQPTVIRVYVVLFLKIYLLHNIFNSFQRD